MLPLQPKELFEATHDVPIETLARRQQLFKPWMEEKKASRVAEDLKRQKFIESVDRKIGRTAFAEDMAALESDIKSASQPKFAENLNAIDLLMSLTHESDAVAHHDNFGGTGPRVIETSSVHLREDSQTI